MNILKFFKKTVDKENAMV